jgi:hypothetical protein
MFANGALIKRAQGQPLFRQWTYAAQTGAILQSIRRPLDEPATPIKQFKIVDDGWVARLSLIGPQEILSSGFQIPAQHVRIAPVI